VADHFGETYAKKALAERRAVNEAEVKSVVNASTEAERKREKMLAEQREKEAPERYVQLLQRLKPMTARFDVTAATEEITDALTTFANTTTAPKFHALKDDIEKLKGLRDRIVTAARQGRMSEMKIEYHQEMHAFKDASPLGPVLTTRNGRVETRWEEFELDALMEMAGRVTDVTKAGEMLELAVFRLYTGKLKDAEKTLGKAEKLGAVVQPYRDQLAERFKVEPAAPETTQGTPSTETKDLVQDAAVVLAFKALGFEVTQGIWKMSSERVMSGAPKGLDPRGEPSRLISLRRSLPPFKTLAVEVRGEAETAGFSFGKGKRWMIAPTAQWQQIVLKVDSATGKSLFTVDGKPATSMETLDEDAVKNLPEMVYLRALGNSIEFRKLAIDDQVTGGGGGEPAIKPSQDPAAAMALKLLGWEIAGGVWTIEGENHFAAVPDDARQEVGVKRKMATCRTISVEIRGKGESAGFSFGPGSRFIVRPTDEWRRLTLEINSNGRPKLLLNGNPAVSLEDVSKVISADLTGTFGLRGVGSKVEFRNFQFE